MHWLVRLLIMMVALALAAVVAWNGFVFIDDRPRSQAAQLERREFAKAHADPTAGLLLTSSRWGSWLLGIFCYAASVMAIVVGSIIAFG